MTFKVSNCNSNLLTFLLCDSSDSSDSSDRSDSSDSSDSCDSSDISDQKAILCKLWIKLGFIWLITLN